MEIREQRSSVTSPLKKGGEMLRFAVTGCYGKCYANINWLWLFGVA